MPKKSYQIDKAVPKLIGIMRDYLLEIEASIYLGDCFGGYQKKIAAS